MTDCTTSQLVFSSLGRKKIQAEFVLVGTLRRECLLGTELANAQVGTICLKLLKIGARVVCSVRRIVLHLAGGYPLKDLFARILGRLSALSVKSTAFG